MRLKQDIDNYSPLITAMMHKQFCNHELDCTITTASEEEGRTRTIIIKSIVNNSCDKCIDNKETSAAYIFTKRDEE